MGFGITVCVIFALAYVVNRCIPTPRNPNDKGLPTIIVAVVGMIFSALCLFAPDLYPHEYTGVAGPLIAKHGLEIATQPDLLPGFFWALLAGPAGALLGNVTAPLAEIVQEPLARAWAWLTSRWQAWRRKRLERKQARLEARREREAATQEAQRRNPQWLKSQGREGAQRIKTVAARHKTFWEELLAYMRVLTVDGFWVWNPEGEITRLLHLIAGLEADLREVRRENEAAKGAPFMSNRPEMVAQLQERLEQAYKLLWLAIAMLNDTDDDMRVIERDLPTGRTFAEERRDALIADFRTLLDQIELVIGASPRRAREELIARTDEEVARLSTGELRAVEANDEIDRLLELAGLGTWKPGERIVVADIDPNAVRPGSRPARSRTAT